MAFSNWLCTNSTKNMLVKIVHPGGHVELHDRPVLAAEIMLRNPRCCVAHPQVFQQPWAIVAPDATLMPGHKFYVVPMGTIRRLQKHSLKQSPAASLVQQTQTSPGRIDDGGGESDDGKSSNKPNCWLFVNKNKRKKLILKEMERDGDDDDESCFACLIGVIKIKASSEETRSSSSSSNGGSETVGLTTTTRNGGSAKRRLSCDHWQPNLQSICEENLQPSIYQD